jgi:hypothetical protein
MDHRDGYMKIRDYKMAADEENEKKVRYGTHLLSFSKKQKH